MAVILVWVFCYGLSMRLAETQLYSNYEAYVDLWGPLFTTTEPPTTPTTTLTTTDVTPDTTPETTPWLVPSVTPDPCLYTISQPDYVAPEEPKTNKTIDELIKNASTGKNNLHKKGIFLVELDMALTALQLTRLKPKYARQLGVAGLDFGEEGATIKPWTNAVIPYEFKKGHFSCDEKYFILKVMTDIQEKTCVTFRLANSYDTNFLRFVSKDGCWSYLGMQGFGRQDLSLRTPGCIHASVIRHALGHAVGLVNEHNHPDRNKYLQIFWRTIPKNLRYNLIKYPPGSFKQFGTSYSFHSAMHFSSKAFSVTGVIGNRTMQTKDPTKHHIIDEPVRELSFTDLKAINGLYNCAARCLLEVECEEPGYLDKNCKCVCPCGHGCGKEVENEVCKNMIGDESCMTMAAAGECRSNPQAMITICCLACTDCVGEVPCGDYNKACKELAFRGACLAMRPYMSIYCRASCGMCPP